MKKIFLKQINKLIEFNNPIFSITIENIKLYRDLIFNISDEIIMSDNDKEIDVKYLIIIRDPFNINLNDTKLVKGLYKKMIELFDDHIYKEINIIEKSLFEIIDYLSIKLDSNISYDDSLDYNKLLSTVSLKFEEQSKDNFLEYLINYIKINLDLFNTKFIISFRLLDFITNDEYSILEEYLKSVGIVLLNINFNSENKGNIDLIIDNDFCII